MQKIFLIFFFEISFVNLIFSYSGKYNIKWISAKTKYPIAFSIDIKQTEKNHLMRWDWLRMRDFKLVSGLSELNENYNVFESNSKAYLQILNYTFDKLSIYDPKLVCNESANEPDLLRIHRLKNAFILIDFKRQYIQLEKIDERLKISCLAEFLVPSLSPKELRRFLKQVDESVVLKMSANSNDEGIQNEIFERDSKII